MKKLGGNQSTLKEMNRLLILKTISEQPLSCSDLSVKIGLSNTGVVTLVDEMVKEGYLIKQDSQYTSVGRRPILISINPYKAMVVSIDFKETIIIKYYSIDKSELLSEKYDYSGTLYLDEILNCIKLIDKTLKNKFSTFELMNICLSLPGKVNKHTGELVYAPYFKNYKDLNLKKIFRDYFNVDIFIDNDLKFAIIAEKECGIYSEKVYNTMYLQIGNGVGCAFYFDGKLHTGSQGLTGEIGSYIVDSYASTNDLFYHQDFKYFSQICSNNNILRIFKEQARLKGYETYLNKCIDDLVIQDIAEGYLKEDILCEKIVHTVAKIIANVLLNFLNVLDFKNIIISRSEFVFGEKFLKKLKQLVNSSTHNIEIDFMLSTFGAESALYGAKSIALKYAYSVISKR